MARRLIDIRKGFLMKILRRVVLSTFPLLVFSWSAFGQSSTITGTITTYAGSVSPLLGAQAITQAVGYPESAVPDVAGGVYFSSFSHQRVYRVAPDGTLTASAGTGLQGFSGDGSSATSAQLNHPKSFSTGRVRQSFYRGSRQPSRPQGNTGRRIVAVTHARHDHPNNPNGSSEKKRLCVQLLDGFSLWSHFASSCIRHFRRAGGTDMFLEASVGNRRIQPMKWGSVLRVHFTKG
jgi:hypothetical protein